MGNQYQEFQAARNRVKNMNKQELLNLLDDLFGRDNLPVGATLNQIKREALDQLRKEWEPVISEIIDANVTASAIKAIQAGQMKRATLAGIIKSLN